MAIFSGKAQMDFTTGKVVVDHPNVTPASVIVGTPVVPSVNSPSNRSYSITDIKQGSFTILTNFSGDSSVINWIMDTPA